MREDGIVKHTDKRPTRCKRTTPIAGGGYLQCELSRGHGGPDHLVHLPDGSPYAFPRQPSEIWE